MTSGSPIVGQNGDIAIPTVMWRALRVKEGDRVRVEVEDGHRRIEPADRAIERSAVIFAHDGAVRSAEDLRAAAEIAIAESALERATS